MSFKPALNVACLALMLPILFNDSVLGSGPVLTGRWGEPKLPRELIAEYPSKKTQALAVVTFSCNCPLARRLVPQLNELREQFEGAGVQFIALFPNGMDDLHEIAEYATKLSLSFPIYKDDSGDPWYERLGLTTTPQVIVLDTRNGYDETNIIYRGQINGVWAGGGVSSKSRDYLADALRAFQRGDSPQVKETAASGCRIAKQSFRDLSRFQGVTYHQDIAHLLARNCASCHREGEPGAELFSAFDSYESVAAMSQVMLDRIEKRLMPPWHATSEEPSWFGGFKHDPRLSDEEVNMFRAWVDKGCPPGEQSDASLKLTAEAFSAASDDWRIGTPDFVFEMPEPYDVQDSRADEYQYYRVAANFPEDRYVQAIQMKPGNKAVVHHMAAIVGPATEESLSGTAAIFKLYGFSGDKVKKIGDWVAGDPFNARRYDPGYALRLPAGHDIFFEMHYTPTGREGESDRSSMGIIWAPQRPEHLVDTRIFNRKKIHLRPHDGHYEKRNYYQFATDVLISAIGAHMHFRGKDFMLYRLENPQTDRERKQLILQVSAYDFNWQRTYEFEQPIRLRAGDALYSVAHFDNSHLNPNNPDPEALVKYGLKSDDEMLNIRLKFEYADFGTSSTSPTSSAKLDDVSSTGEPLSSNR